MIDLRFVCPELSGRERLSVWLFALILDLAPTFVCGAFNDSDPFNKQTVC